MQICSRTRAPCSAREGRQAARARRRQLSTSVFFPGAPPVSAAGLPGYEAVHPMPSLLPRIHRSPSSIRLNQEMVGGAPHPDMKEKFFNTTADVVRRPPPSERSHEVGSRAAGKVIKAANIKAKRTFAGLIAYHCCHDLRRPSLHIH